MWLDPEVARLAAVRMSTNQDMVQRMRLGGLFLCAVLQCFALDVSGTNRPALHLGF